MTKSSTKILDTEPLGHAVIIDRNGLTLVPITHLESEQDAVDKAQQMLDNLKNGGTNQEIIKGEQYERKNWI